VRGFNTKFRKGAKKYAILVLDKRPSQNKSQSTVAEKERKLGQR